MNNIVVSGILTNLQSSVTSGGAPVLKFSVADNYRRKNEKFVNWWNCAIYGKRAESLDWLVNKSKVAVTGRIEQNKSGERTYYNFLVDQIDVLSSPEDGQRASRESATGSRPAQDNGGFDDDIPF